MSVETYKFGQKNNWRNRTWNLIRSALDIPPREARGLFLPGREALDLGPATAKGFLARNMCAVEVDRKVAHAVRAMGVCPVIGATLESAVMAWPKGRPIHFINADFCGGVGRVEGLLLAMWVSQAVARPCVVALNIFRGRERDPRWRRYFARVAELGEADAKNRAVSGLTCQVMEWAQIYDQRVCEIAENVGFGSYKSGNNVMDWCVARIVAPGGKKAPEWWLREMSTEILATRRAIAAGLATYSRHST